jgi:hypothetical protein
LAKDDQGITHVLKLHTKMDDEWRKRLVAPFLTDFRSMLTQFAEDSSIGMFGACALWIPPESQEPTAALACEWGWYQSMDAARAAVSQSMFSGGVFFFARLDMLVSASKDVDLKRELGMCGIGRWYGDVEGRMHWIERAWGVSCAWFGKRFVSASIF